MIKQFVFLNFRVLELVIILYVDVRMIDAIFKLVLALILKANVAIQNYVIMKAFSFQAVLI
jgi:hypothetical protein